MEFFTLLSAVSKEIISNFFGVAFGSGFGVAFGSDFGVAFGSDFGVAFG
jgi:hypothetical protein